MEIKRKFEMLTMTNRRYVIRQSPSGEKIICAECGKLMLTAEQAAKLLGITQRRIFQIVENDTAHFTETEAGAALVCLNSLANILNANGNE